MADLDQPQNEIKKTDQDIASRRNGHEHAVHPDLTTLEVHRGKHQGDKYVRVIRSGALRRVAPGVMRATEQGSRPSGKIGRLYTRVREVLVGKPLPMAAEKYERLNKIRALGVFSTDAISSSAYATEEILLALVVAGTAGMIFSVPVALGIAILLAIVSFSYRQTVHAYPHGGGSYTVSRENLGTQVGLVAAAALLIDYIMTVAVSISAGTAAVTSAIPLLFPYRVEISVGLVVLIMLVNLRGIRESGTIFSVPTYLFIFSLASVIVLGVVRILWNGLPPVEPHLAGADLEPMTFFIVLRAFAAGSVAMSGTEAISNGVPAFKPPESKNAAATLTLMSSILGFFFVGVTFLSHYFGIVPNETETVISQVGRTVLGSGVWYGIFQVSTMLILVLGANTSYADFPRLSSVMARDGFMPHQMSFRGDRLAFTNGIIVLSAIAMALIVAFGGSTHALIPLYAVGVFLSFTCSQAGMVRHWWKTREAGWQRSLVINGIGAILTAVVLVVVWAVKFQQGAWLVFIMIPLLVLLFNGIHRHYQRVTEQLGLAPSDEQVVTPPRQIVIVPIGDLNKASLRALNFARSITKDPMALRVFYEPHEVEEFRKEWSHWGESTPLVLLESPYRSFNEPLLAYIDELRHQDPDAFITIVLPEFIPAHWWENFLHNQTALRLKTALFFRKNTVVVDVPYHLEK